MNRPSPAASLVCVGFDGLAVNDDVRGLIARGVRNVILFARNYQDREQLTELCREIKSLAPPGERLMICVDHEGGRVQRFVEGFTRIPPMREFGELARRGEKAMNEALRRVKSTAYIMALELRSCGIDLNLAPVLDVDSNPANPVIGERAFSSDSAVVARLGSAMIESFQANGMAACAKHFPGHGDTSVDSHFDLPRLPHDVARLREVELVPFMAAIHAGVAGIMTSHIMFDAIDEQHPATMSQRVVTDLLRNELGYDGLVISDDLEMNAIAEHFGVEDAAVHAVRAGVDLLMCCHLPQRQHAIIDRLEQAQTRGDLSETAFTNAARRIQSVHDRFVRSIL